MRIFASDLSRISKCPASASLSDFIRDRDVQEESSQAAKRGKELHKLQALLLTGNEISQEVDIEYRSIATKAAKVIRKALGKANDLEVEKKIFSKILNSHCFLDVVVEKGGTVFIIDSKFGFTKVSPDDLQLVAYGYEYTNALDLPDDTPVNLGIYQPAHDPDSINWHTTTKSGCLEQLMDIVSAARSGVDIFNPGSACRLCPGRVICPAYREDVAERYDYLCDHESLSHGLIPEILSREMLIAYETKKLADSRYKALNALAESIGNLPGWRYRNGRSSYIWNDEGEAAATLSLFGDPYQEPRLKTPAQAAKIQGLSSKVIERLRTKVPGSLYLSPTRTPVHILSNNFNKEDE